MKRKFGVFASLCVLAACTYKEYNTYNQIFGGDDAGPGLDITPAQGGSSGQSGGAGAGGSGGSPGIAGSGGSADTPAPDAAGCTGCVRLSVLTSRTAELQREYSPRLDLSESLVTFRVRIREYNGPVQVTVYVESGDHVPNTFSEEGAAAQSILPADAGWQLVGVDLAPVQAFRAPAFIDDGGAAGSGFDPGVPFDKSRVERIGLRILPVDPSGVLTPAIVEIDALNFSSPGGLDVDFSANQADFELVDEDSATLTHVP